MEDKGANVARSFISINERSVKSAYAKLKDKQRAFVDAYVISGSVRQATAQAGYYNDKGNAYLVLKKPEIIEAIKEVRGELRSSTIASATEVHEFWTTIIRDETVPYDIRLKASYLQAKSLGMLVEKHVVESNTKTRQAITWNLVTDAADADNSQKVIEASHEQEAV